MYDCDLHTNCWSDWLALFGHNREKCSIRFTFVPETANCDVLGIIRYPKQNGPKRKIWIEEPFKNSVGICAAAYPSLNDDVSVSARFYVTGSSKPRELVLVKRSAFAEEENETIVKSVTFEDPIFRSLDVFPEGKQSEPIRKMRTKFNCGGDPDMWSWWQGIFAYTYGGRYAIKCTSNTIEEKPIEARIKYLTHSEPGRRTFEDRLFIGNIEIKATEGPGVMEGKIRPDDAGTFNFQAELLSETASNKSSAQATSA